MRITPEKITELVKNQVFVFGSNESGIHGAGAAKLAREFGAKIGFGFGFCGQSFAIPTKDWDMKVLDLNVINFYVSRFIEFTKKSHSSNWDFMITEIGCGLAGYTPEDIAPMFKECIDLKNICLPQRFIDVINKLNIKNKQNVKVN